MGGGGDVCSTVNGPTDVMTSRRTNGRPPNVTAPPLHPLPFRPSLCSSLSFRRLIRRLIDRLLFFNEAIVCTYRVLPSFRVRFGGGGRGGARRPESRLRGPLVEPGAPRRDVVVDVQLKRNISGPPLCARLSSRLVSSALPFAAAHKDVGGSTTTGSSSANSKTKHQRRRKIRHAKRMRGNLFFFSRCIRSYLLKGTTEKKEVSGMNEKLRSLAASGR